jgi:putative redox protein
VIECKSANENYCCKTEIGGFIIQSDATSDKGGQENGIRPHDILATAYASCLNMTVRMACNKKNIPIANVSTKVELVREEAMTVFTYQIDFDSTMDEGAKNEILKMVENCPIRKTLSKPIEFQLL